MFCSPQPKKKNTNYEKEKEKKKITENDDANICTLQYKDNQIKEDKNDDKNSIFQFTKKNDKNIEKIMSKNNNYQDHEFEIFTDSKIEELKNEKERKEMNLNTNQNQNLNFNTNNNNNNQNSHSNLLSSNINNNSNSNLNTSRNSSKIVSQRKSSFDSVNSDTCHFGGENTNTLGFSTGDLSVIREVSRVVILLSL